MRYTTSMLTPRCAHLGRVSRGKASDQSTADAHTLSRLGGESDTREDVQVKRNRTWRRFVFYWLFQVIAAVWGALTAQGCLPPDWSFCDCDFRDNFWNHVLTDIHLLWDGPGFIAKARDNTTFQGKYLQGPLPPGYDCPLIADAFWKGWPRFGLTRSLIEGSMGDLWMPAARDRFKQICIAGHMNLITICSQHFLVKTAKAIEEDDADHMKWFEAAFSHMVALRNLGEEFRLRQCMPQQGWPLKAWAIKKYAEKWVGVEKLGANPVAAYVGGQLDPYGMLFDEPMHFTEGSRKDSLPNRRPCVPYKEPRCWKRMSKLLMETCEHCCSAFIHNTGRGDPQCFDDVWTYERCCHTDFKDLICEEKRKGEEGGCVDCKKTVSYVCLTRPEKRLQDAMANYNKEVDKYHEYQKESQDLARKTEAARIHFGKKTELYRENYEDYDSKLRVWSVAYNNASRLMSVARLKQQELTWNNSAKAQAVAKDALRNSTSARQNATQIQKNAMDAKSGAWDLVRKNESFDRMAMDGLEKARNALAIAKKTQRSAQVAASSAAAEAAAATRNSEEKRMRFEIAEGIWDAVVADTTQTYDKALAAKRTSDRLEHAAHLADLEAEKFEKAARSANESVHKALVTATAALVEAERKEALAKAAETEADRVTNESDARWLEVGENLKDIWKTELVVNSSLLDRATNSTTMRCLMENTPANMSARPNLGRTCGASPNNSNAEVDVTSVPPAALEDHNEFCKSWAKEGECEENSGFMLKTCAKSCATISGNVPSCSTIFPNGGLQLSTIVSELASLAAAVRAEGWRNILSQKLVAQVPESFRNQLNAALVSLQSLHEKEKVGTQNVTAAEKSLESGKKAMTIAEKNEEAAKEKREVAQVEFVVQSAQKQKWETMVNNNETSMLKASQALGNKKVDHRRLQEAAEHALALEQALKKALTSAESTSAKRQVAMSRAEQRKQILDEHIETLNATINQNVSTALAAWLVEGSFNSSNSTNRDWGSRLLQFARASLVTVVDVLEKFLETYVMSLTDAESVAELSRSVEDRRITAQQLQDASAAVVDADRHSKDAKKSAEKAEFSRKGTEDAVGDGAKAVADAQTLLDAANVTLQQSKAGHEDASRQAELARRALIESEANWTAASKRLEDSVATVERLTLHLKSCKDGLETIRDDLATSINRLDDAHLALEAAAVGAVQMYLAELQHNCGASEADFELYLEYRELLSLLQALVAHRLQAFAIAESQLASSLKNQTNAKNAHISAQNASAFSRDLLDQRAVDSVASNEEMRNRLAMRNSTMQKLVDARWRLQLDSWSVGNITANRSAFREVAKEAETAFKQSLQQANATLFQSESKRLAVRRAMNTTSEATQAMVNAEKVKLEALQALHNSKMWCENFVVSLRLDLKNRSLEDSIEEQRIRNETEIEASKTERRMRALMGTHQRHLKLLNSQLEMDPKDSQRAAAKKLFDGSETDTAAAQKALDGLLKEDKKCHDNIGKTYAAVQRLLKEHEDATVSYNNQDPEDRKRSFSTYLEGSGADPDR